MCSKAQATVKAGDGVNAALTAGTILADTENIVEVWIIEGESDINIRCGYDWTTNFAAAPDATKMILQSACSDFVAMYCVGYDKGGYKTGRLEAEGHINFLRDNYLRKLSLLRDKEKQNFIRDPTTGTIA